MEMQGLCRLLLLLAFIFWTKMQGPIKKHGTWTFLVSFKVLCIHVLPQEASSLSERDLHFLIAKFGSRITPQSHTSQFLLAKPSSPSELRRPRLEKQRKQNKQKQKTKPSLCHGCLLVTPKEGWRSQISGFTQSLREVLKAKENIGQEDGGEQFKINCISCGSRKK